MYSSTNIIMIKSKKERRGADSPQRREEKCI
jgi:hypothetical protein